MSMIHLRSLSICLILITRISVAQSISQIDTQLDSIEYELMSFRALQDSVQGQIDYLITVSNKLTSKRESLLLEDAELSVYSVKVYLDSELMSTGNYLDFSVLQEIPINSSLIVYNEYYYGGRLKAKYGDMFGYVNQAALESSSMPAELKKFISNQGEKIIAERNTEGEWNTDTKRNTIEDFKKKRTRLTEKYGAVDARRILNGQIWIGMTGAMAQESIGNPKDINRTVNSYGIKEQWVYESRNLYFEDGILTTWQD